MTEKRPIDDAALEDLFAAARDTGPLPSADLVARILADADAVIDTAEVLPEPPKSRSFLSELIGAIGGWPSAVGLGAAAMTGVVIGFTSLDAGETLSGVNDRVGIRRDPRHQVRGGQWTGIPGRCKEILQRGII